jgi:hypothetical protein
MTYLLAFLGAVYCVALAAIFAVPIFDRRRAARRQATELAIEERLEKAA